MINHFIQAINLRGTVQSFQLLSFFFFLRIVNSFIVNKQVRKKCGKFGNFPLLIGEMNYHSKSKFHFEVRKMRNFAFFDSQQQTFDRFFSYLALKL